MKTSETVAKMNAAYELLQTQSLSFDTFHHVHQLLKGLHPTLDEKLEKASQALTAVEKVVNGDVVTLTAEQLPEETEEDKKRKKALLFFISSVKDLRSEIKRVQSELTQAQTSSSNTAWHWGRIVKYVKGPLGIITLAAILIVAVIILTHKQSLSKASELPKPTPVRNVILVITYQGKQIPLAQLFVGHGPDCDSPHYHAIGEKTATALDGTVFQDPGGCGFGKVADLQVTSISQ